MEYYCKNCKQPLTLENKFCGWQCDLEDWIKQIKNYEKINKNGSSARTSQLSSKESIEKN